MSLLAERMKSLTSRLGELLDLPNSLRPLVAAKGRLGALSVLAEVIRDKALDPPFAALPAPRDDREKLARSQAEVPLLLYRALRRSMSEAAALGLTWQIVERGAWRTLASMLDSLDLSTYARLDLRQRIVLVQDLLGRFPNIDALVDFAEPTRVGFTVTHCTFAHLMKAVNTPELAPLFCRIDEAYFASRNIRLGRTSTIASGGASCPFRLELAD